MDFSNPSVITVSITKVGKLNRMEIKRGGDVIYTHPRLLSFAKAWKTGEAKAAEYRDTI